MQTRRKFIGNVAEERGSAVSATGQALSANDRIRFGVIGVGERGTQLTREALACPNTECAAFADVYTRRLDDAKKLAPDGSGLSRFPAIAGEDKSIDAVLVATPHHLHAESFNAALDAGKHVYVEKTMAFTLEDARLMRAAYERARKS